MIALLLSVCVPAWAAPANSKADFYVRTLGNDANPGTAAKPFATLARARDAVRQKIAAGLKADVVVLVYPGRYEVTGPIVFGPEDSGTAEHSITYYSAPNEWATLSGGRVITGWKKGEGELWTAQVPGVKEGRWSFRQLFMNGRRAIRARTPNRDANPPGWRLAGAELSGDSQVYKLMLAPGLVKSWANAGDIEVNFFGEWETMRKRVQSVDEAAGVIVLAPPHIPMTVHPWNRPGPGKGLYLENAREFLDQPGEWYLDRQTGLLTYWPCPGQDMTRVQVIAAVATRLLEVKGTAERPVRNLHFRGLVFSDADWSLPASGYQGTQACHFTEAQGKAYGWSVIPAALHFEFAEGCSVTDGQIARLGGCGLFLSNGCHRNVVEGNWVYDISGNGLMVSAPDSKTAAPQGNRLANNAIHACGVDYQGAVGIWDGMTDGTVIAHNCVYDLPYTGISVGWQWNAEPTNCKANVIEYNWIADCMKALSDGGGIYTLGYQPGTIIRGNFITGIRRGPFSCGAPNNGMFIDEGSKGFLIEGNVISATSGAPVRHNQNQPDWHTWKGNFFGTTPPTGGRIGYGLLCDGLSSFFEVPHSAALDPPHLTAEAWVKVPEYPAAGDTRRWVINKNDDEWTQGHFGLVTNREQVGAYLNIGGGQANQHEAWSTSRPLTLNAWHFLSMTYDGANLKVYSDGELVAQTAVNRERVPGNSPLDIGRRQDAYNYFEGIIDEARLYDRALSAAEIKAQYAKPAKPDPAQEQGLVGYWGFEDLGADRDALLAAMSKVGPEAAYRDRWPRVRETMRE